MARSQELCDWTGTLLYSVTEPVSECVGEAKHMLAAKCVKSTNSAHLDSSTEGIRTSTSCHPLTYTQKQEQDRHYRELALGNRSNMLPLCCVVKDSAAFHKSRLPKNEGVSSHGGMHSPSHRLRQSTIHSSTPSTLNSAQAWIRPTLGLHGKSLASKKEVCFPP